MKKHIVKIVLGAVVMLGTATTSFAAGGDVIHVYCSASTTSC